MISRFLSTKNRFGIQLVFTASMSSKSSSSELKPASTVLVVRPNEKTVKGESNFQILMVQRRNSARFFGGAYVFPGGVIENSDADPKWKGMLNIPISQPEKLFNKIPEFAFRIGAIREVFEEINVLISSSKPNLSSEQLHSWRTQIQKDASKFHEMFLNFGMVPKPFNLYPWGHWITPPIEKYRYDTLFFVTVLDSVSNAKSDETETTAFEWFTPQEAIHKFEEGKIFLPPPTWYILNEISQFNDINHFVMNAKQRDFGEEVKPIMPVFLIADEAENACKEQFEKLKKQNRQLFATVILPGDELHPNTSNNTGSRNRIIIHGNPEDLSQKTHRYFLESSTQVKSLL